MLYFIKKNVPGNKATKFQKMAYFSICVCLGSGVLGTVVGVIMMLQDLSDPQALGVGIATSLITVLYSIIISTIFFLPIYAISSSADKEILREENDQGEQISPGKNKKSLSHVIFALVLAFLTIIPILFLVGSTFFTESSGNDQLSVTEKGLVLEIDDICVNITGTEGKNVVLLSPVITFSGEILYESNFKEQGIPTSMKHETIKILRTKGMKFLDSPEAVGALCRELREVYMNVIKKDYKRETVRIYDVTFSRFIVQ